MTTKRRSAEQWQELVDEWDGSGMTAREFARVRGIHPRTLRWWRWRLGRSEPARGAQAFLEVVVDGPEPPDLIIELDGLVVRVPYGFDAGEVRRLMGALC